MGSTNLDHRSFALNEELNVVLDDADVAGRLKAVFEQDLANSRQVTYEQWRRRSLVSRFLELLAFPLREQMERRTLETWGLSGPFRHRCYTVVMKILRGSA